MDKVKGAYSLAVMSPRKLIAVRDPIGFRPLCIGEIEGGWVVASESCALDAIGAKFLRDVEPGEIVTISDKGLESDRSHCGHATAECVFEFIYFARPDSVIDGSCVHTARQRAGAFLALEHPVQADVVIECPTPASTRPSATQNRAAYPTASDLSKASISAARSSSQARPGARTPCA